MEKKELEVLKSEIDVQVREIEDIYKRLDERASSKDKFAVEGLSLWLHNLYCAFEDLFKAVAKAFENNVVDKDRFHIELLKRMTADIKGVRPALVSEEAFPLFDKLRSFRHRLRHAYVYDIEEDKVRDVYNSALKLRALYKKEITCFFKRLGI